ncbi:MAG: hypothetical protein ACM3JB_06670, partial [Acidobacteriaceae bacterium]
MSERQTPQVVVFSGKLSEKVERLDRTFVRPRQVRYQAALRPDFHSINGVVGPFSDSIAGRETEQGLPA